MVKAHLSVAVRRIVVPKHLQRPHHLDACVQRSNSHTSATYEHM